MMKNVLIAGSSGMVGNIILQECLRRDDVAKVTSIVRKQSGETHAKLNEIVHGDFLNFDPISAAFKNIDACFYCVGVYTGTVPREQFRTITVDYTKAFGKVLKAESADACFCFLSGQGADSTEKSKLAFAKDKGTAENFLLGLKFSKTYLCRPGYIYPVEARKEPNIFYSLMRMLYPLMTVVYKNGIITSHQLATAMIKLGLDNLPSLTTTKTVFENKDLLALA